MSWLVITGANGFIGSNMVQHFLSIILSGVKNTVAKNMCKEMRILAVDLQTTTQRDNFKLLQKSSLITYVNHDELFSFLEAEQEPIAAVIHNGACSSTEETNPQIFADLNVHYSQKLWDFCSLKKIPFIYASSAGVYGNGLQGFSDAKGDCKKYNPLSLYAHSKLDFDLWALNQASKPPLWAGLRYFNVYGSREEHKGRQASMVYHAYKQIINSKKMKLYKSTDNHLKDGEQSRDFVYVKDICTLTQALLEKFEQGIHIKDNGLFLNIGTGHARTWNELMHIIFNALNIPANIEYVDMPGALVPQYQNFTQASLTSWREVSINAILTSLEQGVVEYINWLNNSSDCKTS